MNTVKLPQREHANSDAGALDSLDENGLPHCIEAERSILGAILLDNAVCSRAIELLRRDDFYLHSHRRIFEKMITVTEQVMPVDLVTLSDELRRAGEFEQIGGATYIASLIDGVPRTDTIEPYARILLRHSRARQIIGAANDAIARATAGEEDIQSIAVRLESELREVRKDAPDDISVVRRCLADVQAEYVSFLWEPYVPLGKLTLIEGDPGVGKSWLACALAAAAASGRGPDGWSRVEPGNVLLLSVEDGLADTIRPRLDSMRANVERIYALQGALTLDDSGLLILEEHIFEIKPVLVTIDPLVAYLGAGVDLHRANEVRAVTARLALIAEKYGCAIVGVRHLTKGGRDRAIYRGVGSIDFTASARSVLLVGCDPDDSSRRAVAHIKSNLAGMGVSLGYEIRDGCFLWTGESALTAERILGAPIGEGERKTRADAEDFLRDALSEGPRPSEETTREARRAGISQATLTRARLELGIKGKPYVFKTGQPGTDEQRWFWRLPPEHIQANSEDTHSHLGEHLRINSDDKSADGDCLDEGAQKGAFENLPESDERNRGEVVVIEVGAPK